MFTISWGPDACVLTQRLGSAAEALKLTELFCTGQSRLRITDLTTWETLTVDDLRWRAAIERRPSTAQTQTTARQRGAVS